MSTAIPTQIEKCKGAMLATAIGDALGWPNEPRSKNRAKSPKVVDHFVEWTRSSSNPRWHDEQILPGEYSDDTQMTLAVARSIIAGNWEKFFSEKELPFWLAYERGGGGALLKAAKSCKSGFLPWKSNFTRDYFNAGGNGATMRILPHVITAAKAPNISTLMLDVTRDTLITHGHPRAVLGTTCYAYALDYLLRKETVLEYGELVTAVIEGQKDWGAYLNSDIFSNWLNVALQHRDYDYAIEWEGTLTHMVKQLEFIKNSLKKGLVLDDAKVLTELECFGKVNGAGDVATLAAIYLASRYANNPSLGIKIPAFSFGADTDTIASITGGLLGMLSGTSWIPTEWKIVQDYDCLIQITELLLANDKQEATKVGVAEARTQESGWRNSPIGKMRLVDTKQVPNGQHGVVIIRKWQTVLGQTLYTKEAQLFDNKPQQSRQPDGQMQIPQQSTLYDLASREHSKAESKSSIQAHAAAPAQRSEVSQRPQRRFVLNETALADLLGNSQFKQNITVGKVLKIVRVLIEGNKTNSAIAKKFEIDEAMVVLIQAFIE